MTNQDEPKYTLAEARAELSRRECATHGHTWSVQASMGEGPVSIVCEQCGWSGAVTMSPRP